MFRIAEIAALTSLVAAKSLRKGLKEPVDCGAPNSEVVFKSLNLYPANPAPGDPLFMNATGASTAAITGGSGKFLSLEKCIESLVKEPR
jgi:hypothetical protein